ncbi:hypothetical protein [Burkholderia stagnalis]|uniref:hypothetical protein n=1 Tax=Burkholderia stagnalis TaxID=1503054 RepID=UPI000752B8C0|nr:hypothetical protein [Burkholderia stagnalis]KVO61488.1 hypothetical protein WT18_09740 [Burkholderia stagnalis]KVP13091.1 hypothetical protein WT20_11455 [Burkholderia stagnalis]KVW96604.1 hypothetical protein WT30_12510 [Burkholderia stagnalis]KWH75726.1 hypothetical protein WT66_02740 [Burkholderia stagnalis]KWK19077.1 hypothetical protein WT77_26815 [Burkholderia stagnalis]
MKLVVSTPVQLVMAVTLVVSAVALLQPDSLELPILVERAGKSPVAPHGTGPTRMEPSAAPWQRPQLPDPTVADMAKAPATPAELPPLPPAGVHVGSSQPPPLPSGAASPQSPAQDIVYLGRMIQDGKTRVFFASNGNDPVVLNIGDVLNDSWKIQSITSTTVTLQHVRSSETRLIAMGGAAGGALHDGTSTQVGQGFLASNPAGVHVTPVN